jgi:AcrR family transcriptional regulator
MSSTPTLEASTSDKRARILDAALALFAERGFHGTAVPLVAKRANVGAGTIYRYFESKEALVNELYRREKQRVTGHVMDGFPGHLSPREQFHHFFRRIIGFAREEKDSFTFLEHHHHAAYLDEQSRMVEQRVLALATAYLTETARARITKPVLPCVLTAIVWGAIVRLMKEAWDGHLELNEEILDQAEAICWEAVRL